MRSDQEAAASTPTSGETSDDTLMRRHGIHAQTQDVEKAHSHTKHPEGMLAAGTLPPEHTFEKPFQEGW